MNLLNKIGLIIGYILLIFGIIWTIFTILGIYLNCIYESTFCDIAFIFVQLLIPIVVIIIGIVIRNYYKSDVKE